MKSLSWAYFTGEIQIDPNRKRKVTAPDLRIQKMMEQKEE